MVYFTYYIQKDINDVNYSQEVPLNHKYPPNKEKELT